MDSERENGMTSTVIIGSGIIGISTAYYLSLQDEKHTIHVVDSGEVLFENVASGKAAGFLAKNWVSTASAELGELSFNLHAKLAKEFGGREKWGWSESSSFSLNKAEGQGFGQEWDWLTSGSSRSHVLGGTTAVGDQLSENSEDLGWLESMAGLYPISDRSSTAQVDPLRMCQFLLKECRSRSNVHLHYPARVSINNDSERCVIVQREGSHEPLDVSCDNIVVTSGPWTTSVLSNLFPDLPPAHIPKITSLSGHSVVLRSKHWPKADLDHYPCQALFINDPTSGFSPELFSRVGGEIYVAGVNDPKIPTPTSPSRAPKPKVESISRLIDVCRQIFRGGDVDIISQGLCFRPITESGDPIIGRIKARGDDGPKVYVGAGHGPWGITLSLGTGMVLSEMILGQPTSADVSRLAPG